MFATDERHINGHFWIRVVFSIPADKNLHILLFKLNDRESYKSITPYVPAAHWYEREIYDMFGIKAEGHPDSRRLVFHDSFPENSFPLRKDLEN
jgi:Ni,Fe-hydrogenase III component G